LKEFFVQKLERIVLFLVLLAGSGFGQAFLVGSGGSGDSGGQPVMQVAFAALYLAIALFLVKYRTAALRLVMRERWMAALCLWALVSAVWSVDPNETLRRSLALAGTCLAGLYLGMRYELKDQLRLMAWAIGIGAVCSLLAVVVLPGVGFSSDGGLQGVYNMKNSLGRMMSMGAFCFGLLAVVERRHRAFRLLLFLLCCALLVLSKSATAVVVTVLMFALLPLRRLLYLRARKLAVVAVCLGPVAAAGIFWLVESSDEVLQSLGRTSSLTGRIPLWHEVLKEVALRPFRGFGFSAFWGSWDGQRVSDTVAWDTAVPNSHNGFLEIWLGLGLIGLALLLISLARTFVLGFRAARSHRSIDASWPLLLVLFTVLYNLTESSLLGVNSLPWTAYAAVSFWLVRAAREEAVEPELQIEAQREREPAYSA
jgi:exopolysaccharide production protein ExoQ